jgi:hypothetical protein
MRRYKVQSRNSEQAALKNITEAIELCLEVRAERRLPLTVETREVEVALELPSCLNGPNPACYPHENRQR